MRRPLVVFCGAVVAAPVVVGLAAPAAARPPAAALTGVSTTSLSGGAVSSSYSGAVAPSTQIRKLRNSYGFKPDRLVVPATVGACSSSNYSFVVDNGSKSTQQLTFNGVAVGASQGYAEEVAVCVSGGAGASGVFGLASSGGAHLKVTIG